MSARVLLVGPVDQSVQELKAALEQEGFLTETARDGVQAIETGGRFQPHLVIAETVLSGISGFELSSRIWNGEAGFIAPVVFYTESYRDEKLRMAALDEHHALHYFVKPFQKEALLNTVVPLLAKIERSTEKATQNKTQVQASVKRVRTKKIPRQVVERSAKTGSLARESQWLLRPLANDQLTSIDKARTKKGSWGLLESSPESQDSQELPTLGSPENLHASRLTSTQGRELDSGITNESFDTPFASKTPIEPEPPPSSDPVSALTGQIPEESDIALLSKEPFYKRIELLVGAMTVFAVVGLSLALRSSSSDFHRLEVSRRPSDLPGTTEVQMSSSARGDVGTPADPASLNQPEEPGASASEAVARWLQGSKSNQSATLQTLPTRRPEQKSESSVLGSSPTPELIISDISPVERQSFLTSMVPPQLSATQFRAMGSKSFLVSLELEQSGHVRKAFLVTPDPEGVFPDQILETVRKWRFVPRDEAQRGSWVKYFSFKAPRTAH